MEQKYSQKLRELFQNPPNEFRMMPFWFWNHEMVEKEVQRQIRDHHDHGIGGEFIHPRHGRLTPYMGRRWLENVEAAADQCKALEMPSFLYDEDNWPSGPAGGYITGPSHPENRAKMITLFDENVFDPGEHVEYDLDYAQISEDAQFCAAIAVPNPPEYPKFGSVISRCRDLTDCVKNAKFVWDVPDGEEDWTVIFFAILTTPYNGNLNGYIDILRKETVKEFIDFTHKRYVDYFIEKGKEDYLGTVVPGIFTDEPSMAQGYGGYGEMLHRIVFTPEMPRVFKEMFGYEFNLVLLSLFYDTGSIATKHRCHFWTCATKMYVDAFYKQIYEYCDRYKLRTTGHINAEGSFPSHIYQQGDFFKVFEYMHYGGCDQLTEDVRPDNLEELWSLKENPYMGMANEMLLTSKFASSAAHLLGKSRVLVEAWGTSSWDITMASAKRVNDFLIATGCDLFVPHSFNYSEDGYRKGDHPAAFNYQPYYPHWKLLADYNARLCTLFNAHSGILRPEVLLFYPTKGFYSELMPLNSDVATIMSHYLTHEADCLFRQQLDFELANEDLILSSHVEKDRFSIRNENFRILFLGATPCIGLKFAQWMKKYFDGGGKILATAILPFREENTGESTEVAQIMQEIFGVNPKEHYNLWRSKPDLDVKLFEKKNINGGCAIFVQSPTKDPWMVAFYPVIEQACRKLLPPEKRDVVVWRDFNKLKHAAYVMSLHKQIEKKEFFFFANTSRTISYPGAKIIISGTPQTIELWDAISGEVLPIPGYGIENGCTTLNLDFPPYRSYIVVVKPAKGDNLSVQLTKDLVQTPLKPVFQTIPLDKKWQLGFYGINGAMLHRKWESSYDIEAGKAWGYRSHRVFAHKFIIQDLQEIRPIKLVIEGLVGDYAWCKTTLDNLSGGDRAHFTFPNTVTISVNDQPVSIKFDFTPEFLDPCWIVADISNYLHEGQNEVKMECSTRNHQTFHVVTDPWRLIGKFSVDETTGIPKLKKVSPELKAGDIAEQGLIRYHGPLGYIQSVDIPSSLAQKKFHLQIEDTIDCVEVIVNGHDFGPCWYQWDVDVTEAIHPGKMNTIELRYYGIAQNMLQTNLKPQGIRGKVKLQIFS